MPLTIWQVSSCAPITPIRGKSLAGSPRLKSAEALLGSEIYSNTGNGTNLPRIRQEQRDALEL